MLRIPQSPPPPTREKNINERFYFLFHKWTIHIFLSLYENQAKKVAHRWEILYLTILFICDFSLERIVWGPRRSLRSFFAMSEIYFYFFTPNLEIIRSDRY